jgi:hypothetical protein
MSQQAGIHAVKDQAIFLSGQMLVGGSSLMYLKALHENRHELIAKQPGLKTFFKRVNLRTSGYVVFCLTVQAVGYQSYAGDF